MPFLFSFRFCWGYWLGGSAVEFTTSTSSSATTLSREVEVQHITEETWKTEANMDLSEIIILQWWSMMNIKKKNV